MNNFKDSEQNSLDSRSVRDNFKNIKKFMDAENFDSSSSNQDQTKNNKDLRDNFKNIQGFKDTRDNNKENR